MTNGSEFNFWPKISRGRHLSNFYPPNKCIECQARFSLKNRISHHAPPPAVTPKNVVSITTLIIIVQLQLLEVIYMLGVKSNTMTDEATKHARPVQM